MENKDQITDVNTLIERRLEELNHLKEMGVETYRYEYEVDSSSKEIKDNFDKLEGKDVKIAGRLMSIRKMGKASFVHIMDSKGRIQVYLRKDEDFNTRQIQRRNS